MPRGLKVILYLLGVPIAIAMALWVIFYPLSTTSLTYRYRLTIEVDTPEGTKTGSTVVEQWMRLRRPLWKGHSVTFDRYRGGVRGEAAFVDLGAGHHILAILARGPTGREDVGDFLSLGTGAIGIAWGNDDEPRRLEDAIARRAKVNVPLKVMPTLVTFRDLNDPNSAEVVSVDSFARAFGPGYAFRSATIEYFPAGWWPANQYGLSGIPLTHEIEARIPEILRQVCERDKQRRLSYPTGPYDASMGHFMRGKRYRDSCARTL